MWLQFLLWCLRHDGKEVSHDHMISDPRNAEPKIDGEFSIVSFDIPAQAASEPVSVQATNFDCLQHALTIDNGRSLYQCIWHDQAKAQGTTN